jgi:hypothetical protein
MPLENWIQHSRVDQFLYDWQTGLAGAAALLAAFIAVGVTRRQIVATREQTALTEHLEKDRRAREASAFYALLAEAMKRVIAEADRAKEAYSDAFAQKFELSAHALAVRQSITKGAFAELRAACVQQGGPLTGEFLDLEREIDSFAAQWKEHPTRDGATVRTGKEAGLGEQLALIETNAAALRDKAVEQGNDTLTRLDSPKNKMDARWLNTIGLALGIVGVLIIFIWGPPQPNFNEFIPLSLVSPEAQHMVEDTKRLKRQHQIMSRIGLSLVGLGFGAQLIAVWRAPA